MNILREEFCKEKNVPMGLDNVYDYCTWLEKKLTESNQALQLHKTQVSGSFSFKDMRKLSTWINVRCELGENLNEYIFKGEKYNIDEILKIYMDSYYEPL